MFYPVGVLVGVAILLAVHVRRPLRSVLQRRSQRQALEDLVARGVIRRLTWTVGGVHPDFPDMILVQGDGWSYEPFLPVDVGRQEGSVPAEVAQVFARFGPHTDDALRVLGRLQMSVPGIKHCQIHYGPGMTVFRGMPRHRDDILV